MSRIPFQVAHDTAANWTSNNPTLASGEFGFETDTYKLKAGDGSTAWASLSYIGSGGTGTVTSVSTAAANNGITATWATATTTPALTIGLGAITPTSVAATTTVSGTTITASTAFSGPGTLLTSIPNSALTNSSLTVGSTNIALGATSTTLAGLTGLSSSSITDTSMTQGSILYAGTGGLVSQDNSNFYYNPTGYAGMPHLIYGPGSGSPNDAAFEFYVSSGVNAHFHNINPTQSITGGVTVQLLYTPTGAAVSSGNRVGSLEFGGTYDTTYDPAAISAIRSYTTQTLSSGSLGGNLVFQTVPNGSTTLTTALTLNQDQTSVFASSVTGTSFNSITGLGAANPLMDGSVSVGSSTLVSRQDHVHPSDTTRASSSATLTLGSTLLTLGGTTTSIAGLTLTGAALNGTLGATTPSTIAATTLGASGIFSETNTTDASAIGTASTVFSGGISVAKSQYLGGILYRAGTGTPTTHTNLMYEAWDTQNAYIQNDIQNLSTGASASADYIATCTAGTDTANYVDLGVNGSGYSVGTWTINGANDGYLFMNSNNLAVGTDTAGKNLVLFTGGTLSTNARLTLSDTQATFSGPVVASLGITAPITGTIGATTPNTGAFTTISATGVITSTLSTGTAPFTIASTTVVPNLNVSQLLGNTWVVPGAIGATTPNTGVFTALSTNNGLNITPVTNPTSGSVSLITTTGNLGIGVYYYGVAYQTSLGTTGYFQLGTVTTDASHEQVTVTIPVSADSRVTGRKIYRTKVGGANYQTYNLTTVSDNTTTTYTDNIADSSLTVLGGYWQPNTTTQYITINGTSGLTIDPKATYLGVSAGASVSSGGGQNTLIGYQAGTLNTSAQSNTFIGHQAGAATTTGGSNTYIGVSAGGTIVSGTGNIGIGVNTLNGINGGGSNNTAVGYYALGAGTPAAGNYSTALGLFAGYLATGSNNIFIGAYCGRYQTTQTNVLMIDSLDRTNQANGIANALIYGVTNATATSNTLQLGGTGIVTVNGTQASTTTGTGSLVVSGGLGVAGNAFIGGLLGLTAGSGGTTAGELWYDSTQLCQMNYNDGVKQANTTTLFTQTATGTNGAATALTNILGTGIGTAVLPASFFVTGKSIRVKTWGTVTTNSTTPGTTVITLYLNAGTPVTVVATPSLTLTANMTSMPFVIDLILTCRSATTVMGGGTFTVSNSTTGISSLVVGLATTTAATIVNATSYTINVSATNGTASGTIYTTQGSSIEIMN